VLLSLTQRRRRFAQPSVYGLRLLTVRFPVSSAVECIPIAEARQHIGEDQCVSGKAVRVKQAGRGVTLFDFCQDSMVCPFTVVVFAHVLKRIGDVSQLQNKVIEVHGPVKEYDGRAEIVLQQLRATRGRGLGDSMSA
jgi:DNA/RNA endonuclease YhcR with UshA esterase domain